MAAVFEEGVKKKQKQKTTEHKPPRGDNVET